MTTVELIGGPLDGTLRAVKQDPPPDTMFYPYTAPVRVDLRIDHPDETTAPYEVARYRRDLRHAMSVPGVWRYIYSP